jgi:anti-sigma factor RsiW
MTGCNETLTALLLGTPLDPAATAHLAACPRCTAEQGHVRDLARALAAGPAPVPPVELSARLLRAARPLLDRNARRAAWVALARALAAALVPLPAILFADAFLVRWAYGLLAGVLPAPLGLLVVVNYAATLTVLLALTYAAIPILADRQVRLRLRESHA